MSDNSHVPPGGAPAKREGGGPPARPLAWRFGGTRLDERTLELRVDGDLVALERKPLEVLRVLLRRAGELVTHDDLLDAVWPGRILSDSVVKKCVSQVRDALRDTDQTIVKTVHGYGYRLMAPVEVEALEPSLLLSPGVRDDAPSVIRRGAALLVEVAGTIELRNEIGAAAAAVRIRPLVDQIVMLAQARRGAFIQSYGDDVLAVFEEDPVTAAASVAIAAHRAARQAGMQVYAGLHAGMIEFRQSMGRLDAAGPAVDMATGLNRLSDGVPGRIFLSDDAAAALSAEWRARATPYGPRELRGIGTVNVWTLDWHEASTSPGTEFAEQAGDAPASAAALVLRHGAVTLRLEEAGKPFFIGRDRECALRVADPQPRVSSKHVMIEKITGHWVLQDISRNGTHLRDAHGGDPVLLPYCTKTMIPMRGELCLGRAFADDPDGLYTVCFERSDAS